MITWIKEELWFRLSCDRNNHKHGKWTEQIFKHKFDVDRPDIVFHICSKCSRVNQEEVDGILDVVEKELDELEQELELDR